MTGTWSTQSFSVIAATARSISDAAVSTDPTDAAFPNDAASLSDDASRSVDAFASRTNAAWTAQSAGDTAATARSTRSGTIIGSAGYVVARSALVTV